MSKVNLHKIFPILAKIFLKMNTRTYFSLLSITIALLLSSCGESSAYVETHQAKGVDASGMDTSVDPCHNFFEFANGNWVKNNPIPGTESRWSNFNVLRDKNDSLLIDILKEAANGNGDSRVGDFYIAAMDTVSINKKGIDALKTELTKIEALKSIEELPALLAHHNQIGVNSFLSSGVDQDIKNNTEYIMYSSTGSLGLPDRDYYVLEHLEEKKNTYIEHLHHMFELMGYSEADAIIKTNEVMSIETALAKASLTRVERRDPERTYNKMSLTDLMKTTPKFNWNNYYKTIGVEIDQVVVTQPDYLEALNNILSNKSLAAIKTALEWNLVNTTAGKLSEDLAQQNFDFYAKYLRGVKEMKPRWKRVLSAANASLGQLLGKEYVKVAFSEKNKEKVDKMVDNLIAVLGKRIKALDWMGEETKAQALKKLGTITRKMGYPEEWKDYSSLSLSKDSYVQNWFNCNLFAFKEEMSKLGKAINKKEWFMPPQTVNAYYNPVMNEIVFPAGILQPPFFDITKDDAINYGSMGAVIGHELTHGFDDQGNQFDADGNLKNWWTEEDKANFKTKAQKLIDLYSSYEVLDSTFINGALTQGENIADIGGLSIAYEAYLTSLTEGEKAKEIDGYTPSQRFFIAFGQVWRNNQTDEYLKQQVLTDPHSPAKFRVIGVLSNMPEFNEAFKTCNQKSEEGIVKIW